MRSHSFVLPGIPVNHPDFKKRMDRLRKGPSPWIAQMLKQWGNELMTGDHVLELGSGEARNALLFKHLRVHYYGIEIDPMALAISRQQIRLNHLPATIIEGSFTDLSSFANGSVRLILTQSSIQNAPTVRDIELIFSEMNRVLIPGGLVFLNENFTPRKKDADRKIRVSYFTKMEIEHFTTTYQFTVLSGHEPITHGVDSDRVGGKKIIWHIVLRK